MIKLIEATVHKYKCIENDQTFEVDDKVTVLVGMNESGKTSILEALAKTNYFESDEKFTFNTD
ncbi:MAG: AAA family ATPase [Burkholderiales bacterium]|nr:AAA family ATPase [Nitrosomonas sp.]MCP5274455.1 AAA family ATPase [Burkholderiales bacterium]